MYGKKKHTLNFFEMYEDAYNANKNKNKNYSSKNIYR